MKGEEAQPLVENGCITPENFANDILPAIKADPVLSRLELVAHVNDNRMPGNEDGSGFVGYAFRDPETNDMVFMLRGSEGAMNPAEAVDWKDNFLNTAFTESRQLDAAEAFIRENMTETGSNLLTGHSKGDSLCLNMVSRIDGLEGRGFNGQGLSPMSVVEDPSRALRLMESGYVSYHAGNDPVSRLMCHFGEQVFVDVKPFVNDKGVLVDPRGWAGFTGPFAHYTGAFDFNEDGSIKVSADQSQLHYADMISPVNQALVNEIAKAHAAINMVKAEMSLITDAHRAMTDFQGDAYNALYDAYHTRNQRLMTAFVEGDYKTLALSLNGTDFLFNEEGEVLLKGLCNSIGQLASDLQEAGEEFIGKASDTLKGYFFTVAAPYLAAANNKRVLAGLAGAGGGNRYLIRYGLAEEAEALASIRRELDAYQDQLNSIAEEMDTRDSTMASLARQVRQCADELPEIIQELQQLQSALTEAEAAYLEAETQSLALFDGGRTTG